MTSDEIINLAKEMRAAQKSWFKFHNQADLTKSKQLERQLDKAIEEYQTPDPQMDLFG